MYSNQGNFVISKTAFIFLFLFLKSNQNVLLCLPHRATSVPHLLEPRTATISQTIAAADFVLRASHSHVFLTQPLGLDTGSQHFALQKAVAARVSTILMEMSKVCGDHCERLFAQAWSHHQTTLATIQTTLKRPRR